MKDYINNRLKNNVGKKYVGTLQKQNDLMQADFEQNLKEMSIDFKVSMKTKEREFEQLQEASERYNTDKIHKGC